MCKRHIILIVPLLLLTGCPGATAPPTSQPLASIAHADELGPPSQATAHTDGSAAPQSEQGPAVVALDVYQLTVPYGAVSRSDEFWKRVEEPGTDVGTYDLLLKNGVRVGIGDNKDWPFFKSLIDNYHSTAMTGSSSLSAIGQLELPLKTKIDSQDIFWFDTQDILCGRTFERCDNLLTITFEPHPHSPDHVIVKVCPLVRGLRKQLQFTVLNGEREVELKEPEQLLDLHVEADIPPAHFLILGPTAQAKWPTSLGQAFFVKPGPAERMETTLILDPRTVHLTQLP
jgi:hypothetical protein